jgi:hypothetical protein
MIELQLAHIPLGDADLNNLPLEIDALDCSLEKPHSTKARPDWLGAMPKLQHSGARLEQQRTEKKEIIATDQCDFDVMPAANQSIESARGRETADAAT